MDKIYSFAVEFHNACNTCRVDYQYSLKLDEVARICQKAIAIGGFGGEVAKTIMASHGIGEQVARCTFKQAKAIAITVCRYKPITYTVTWRTESGQIKTSTHVYEESFNKLAKRGWIIEFTKNN